MKFWKLNLKEIGNWKFENGSFKNWNFGKLENYLKMKILKIKFKKKNWNFEELFEDRI